MKETLTLVCVLLLMLMFCESRLGSGNFLLVLVDFSCFRVALDCTSFLVGGLVGWVEGFSAEKMAISWLKFLHLLGVFLVGLEIVGGFFRLGILVTSGFGDFFLSLMDFLELVANPKCFMRVSFPSILINSCWLMFGWGFFFLSFFCSCLAFWGILGNGG